MERTYGKTNLFLMDKALWTWAKYKSAENNFTSVSEYVFDLIKKDKKPTRYFVTNNQEILGDFDTEKEALEQMRSFSGSYAIKYKDVLKVGNSEEENI